MVITVGRTVHYFHENHGVVPFAAICVGVELETGRPDLKVFGDPRHADGADFVVLACPHLTERVDGPAWDWPALVSPKACCRTPLAPDTPSPQ